MAKRVLKNKRLMRNLLILAGFLIVGFFIWTMLFKNTKIFEGQTIQTTPFDNAVEKCAGKPFDNLRTCLITELEITEAEFNTATSVAQKAAGGIVQNDVFDQLRTYINVYKTTPPQGQPSTQVGPDAEVPTTPDQDVGEAPTTPQTME
jgi:hypothetical protein